MSGTNKVRVALIGIGGFAELTIADIFEAMDGGRDDFEIVATVDPFGDKSKHFLRLSEMGIPHFTTLEEMTAKGISPELCVITTPIQFHREQMLQCLKLGASVLCEKPMTGDISDIAILEEAERNSNGFIAIGYQWSYSDAIQKLKADIMRGVYGKPRLFKTMVLWPRNKEYFKRSTGWAGKIFASNGVKILDSVANNATAHYIHNILYVLGDEVDKAACVKELSADLIRVNDIETFDTCVAKFTTECGVEGLYIVSHSTKANSDPRFEYIFENGSVTFDSDKGVIEGVTSDGRKISYGNPFDNRSKKFFDCVDYVKNGKREVLCGTRAASGQMQFISMLEKQCRIYNADKNGVSEADGLLYIDGLDTLLERCYRENITLSELSLLSELTAE